MNCYLFSELEHSINFNYLCYGNITTQSFSNFSSQNRGTARAKKGNDVGFVDKKTYEFHKSDQQKLKSQNSN
jgi:hypothetical protein